MAHFFDEILETLNKAGSIIIATHIYPDADALGSQLGLGNILESLGKNVCYYSEDNVSPIYEFLPGVDKVHVGLPDLAVFDCAVALDCGDSARLGRAMAALLNKHPFVVIDHHAGNNGFGDLNWVDSRRAATGEMIYDLAVALEADISYDAAYCLYAAIVSDTGSFKYNSTTAETLRAAADLLGMGIKAAEIAGRLFDNFTERRLRLLRDVLGTLELHGDGRLAIINVSRKMMTETGTTISDTENFINYPRSLATVKAAAFIKESKGEEISVSLRSKGNDCDVAQVAVEFGGGGHRNAAGFRIAKGSIADIRRRLLNALLPIV